MKKTELKSYLQAQTLCEQVLQEASVFCQPGVSEKEICDLILAQFRRQGVKHFFHQPFAWFGDRSRFQDFITPLHFMPTARKLLKDEAFILDAAPVVDGYICDVGLSFAPQFEGETLQEFQRGQKILQGLYQSIPKLFESEISVADIWQKVDQELRSQNADNCHQFYPFEVLGHRVYKSNPTVDFYLLRFGLGSAQNILSHGLFSQLLGPKSKSPKEGLWAIEPHLGLKGFGMKFEELIYVQDGKAQWLKQMHLQEEAHV